MAALLLDNAGASRQAIDETKLRPFRLCSSDTGLRKPSIVLIALFAPALKFGWVKLPFRSAWLNCHFSLTPTVTQT